MIDAIYRPTTIATNQPKVSLKVDTTTDLTITSNLTIQKLKSDYWEFSQLFSTSSNNKVNGNPQSVVTTPLSLSSDLHTGNIAVSTSLNQDKLVFFKLCNNEKYKIRDIQLKRLYSINVPTGPITKTAFLPEKKMGKNGELNSSYILTGHQNGVVNLIRTNSESSAILKRFNFSKYLKRDRDTFSSSSSSTLVPERQNSTITSTTTTLPITQLETFPIYSTQSNSSFVTLMDKSLFVCNLAHETRNPIYKTTIPDIASFTISPFSKDIITLNTSTSLSFVDLRVSTQPTELIPSLRNVRRSIYTSEYEIVTTKDQPSTELQIYDIRNLTTSVSKLQLSNKPTYVKSLRYDSDFKTLYVLDTIGNLSRWDISEVAPYRTYKQPWYTRGTVDSSSGGGGSECGDMVVSDAGLLDIEMVGVPACPVKGVLAYGLVTLGLHRLVEMPAYVGSCGDEEEDVETAAFLDDTCSELRGQMKMVSEQEYVSDGSTLRDLDE